MHLQAARAAGADATRTEQGGDAGRLVGIQLAGLARVEQEQLVAWRDSMEQGLERLEVRSATGQVVERRAVS